MSDKAGPSPESKHISPGKKMLQLRKLLKMTQAEMAEAIGVTRPTVSAYENRPGASPSHEVILRTADLLNIELAWFYDGSSAPPRLRSGAPLGDSDSITFSQSEGTVIKSKDGSSVRIDPDAYGDQSVQYLVAAENSTEDEEAYRVFILMPGQRNEGLRALRMYDPGFYAFLQVKGQYLAPRAPQGSGILFLRTPVAPINSLVVVTHKDRRDTFYVKKLVEDDDHKLRLRSYKPGVPDLDPEEYPVWGAALFIIRRDAAGNNIIEENEGRPLIG